MSARVYWSATMVVACMWIGMCTMALGAGTVKPLGTAGGLGAVSRPSSRPRAGMGTIRYSGQSSYVRPPAPTYKSPPRTYAYKPPSQKYTYEPTRGGPPRLSTTRYTTRRPYYGSVLIDEVGTSEYKYSPQWSKGGARVVRDAAGGTKVVGG